MGNGTLAVTALAAGGFGAIIASIVTGLFSKKKLGAEATEIIQKAAAGVVLDLRTELARVNTERAEDQKRHEAQMERVRETLTAHRDWDALVIEAMKDLNVDLPPPPPLLRL